MTITASSAPSSLLCRSRSSGKATAIAAMKAAMTRNVFIVLLVGSRGGLIVERHACTLACDAIDNDATQQQHDERSTPNEKGFGLQRRIEAHELAIALRHEIEYGIVAL